MQEIFLSSNLKHLRIKKKITQKQIADYLGKTDGAISFWEKGSREPNALDLSKLSTLFQIPVSDLLLKDLRFENENDGLKELYDANEHLLTEEDKDMIKFVIEKRIKNVNSQR